MEKKDLVLLDLKNYNFNMIDNREIILYNKSIFYN